MGIIRIGLRQNKFSEDDINSMLSPPRRRQLTNEWEFISEPKEEDGDFRLGVPFTPFKRSFDEIFNTINHIGWKEGSNHTYYTYLKDVTDKEITEIKEYFESIKGCVAIRDCLPISFAIDFERETGNPDLEQTEIGEIRSRAKPYGTKTVSKHHYSAADELAEKTIEFIKKVRFYSNLDTIIGMPPSDPKKKYKLTHYLADKISKKLGYRDLSHLVEKLHKTTEAKSLPVTKKLEAITGSVNVSKKISGRKILLLDDLYQSGITMNYVAMLILNKGAEKVYGLACEKTCRNDDNTGE